MGIIDSNGRPLITTDEASMLLEISRAAVFRRIKTGELVRVKAQGSKKLYITLESAEDSRACRGLTLQEISLRLLKIERAVREIQWRQQKYDKSSKRTILDHYDLERMEEIIAKYHD